MAGRPLSKSQAFILDQLGEDLILDLRASGLSLRKLLEKLGGGITVRPFYTWLDSGNGADVPTADGATRRERWNKASEIGAFAIVDRGAEKFDLLRDEETGRVKADVTREEVSLVKAETEYDKWRASVQNPAMNAKPDQMNITIGELHLSAVKRISEQLKQPKALPQEAIAEAEYEVVAE